MPELACFHHYEHERAAKKTIKNKSLYDKFFWGQAVELALVLVTITLKVLVTSPTLEASPIPKLNFSVAKEFFCSLGLGYPTTLNFKPLLRNDEGKSSVLNMGTSEASRCHTRQPQNKLFRGDFFFLSLGLGPTTT